MLYIISTPIGNLSDITYRAIETLKSCDYILCEDTRHSRPLLTHYGIEKPLKSFHKFNEHSAQEKIITDLHAGLSIAIISDAGTPGISDPGMDLVKMCIAENIRITALPGPCAAVTALCLSGLDSSRFQFWGFLARKTGELKRDLREILSYPGTTICYESPHRLIHSLKCLQELAPDRSLAVGRELTKKFEEMRRGVAQDLLHHWETTPLKGEVVLLIAGNTGASETDWIHLTPQEHVELMRTTYRLELSEAIQAVARIRGTSKRDIYNVVHR